MTVTVTKKEVLVLACKKKPKKKTTRQLKKPTGLPELHDFTLRLHLRPQMNNLSSLGKDTTPLPFKHVELLHTTPQRV